jgi:hypothetical protein
MKDTNSLAHAKYNCKYHIGVIVNETYAFF